MMIPVAQENKAGLSTFAVPKDPKAEASTSPNNTTTPDYCQAKDHVLAQLRALEDSLTFSKNAPLKGALIHLIGNFTANQDKPRCIIHTAAEALEPQDPPKWIIQDLFAESSVTLVVGDPGSKKTWSLLDAAVCVGAGESWLGYSSTQAPVLLVDEESGERRLKRRLGQVMRGHEATADLPVYWTSLAQFNLLQQADLDALQAAILETQARFVVIDALADVMPGGDENSVRDTLPVFRGLRAIAETTQAAIVVIHHTNKNGGYRGSSAILGAVDLMLTVSSKLDSVAIDFDTTKARDVSPFGFSAVAHFEDNLFRLAGLQGKTKGAALSETEEAIYKYLQNQSPIGATVDDIIKSIDLEESTIRKALDKMKERKIVNCLTVKKPFKWFLTEGAKQVESGK